MYILKIKEKLLFFLFFIAITSFSFSQDLFFIQKDGDYIRFREPDVLEMSGNLIIRADTLKQFGAGVTGFENTNKYYIINNLTSEVLIVDPIKGLTLNFLDKIDGMVMIVSGQTYLSAKTAFEFLGYKFDFSENFYVYKEEDIISLEECLFEGEKVIMRFSSSDFDEKTILKINTKGIEAEINLFPVNIDYARINGLAIEKKDEFYTLFKLNFSIPVAYTIKKNENEAEIIFSHSDPYLEALEDLGEGIQYFRKSEKFGSATLKVSYLEINTQKASFSIEPSVAAMGLGTKESVQSMALRSSSIAAVNGSYFDTSTNFPVGILIKEGKVLSEPFYYPRPFFVNTYDGKFYILNLVTEIHLSLGPSLFLVKGVNKFSKNGDVIIYTEEFGPDIPFMADRDYVVIVNGVVFSKSYTQKVPKGGFITMLGPSGVSKFVKIGDEATYYLIIPGFPYKVRTAIEGGPRIIEGGKIIAGIETEIERYGKNIITGKTPRTVIALAPSKIVFLVIDGYQTESSGLTFEELADFLLLKGYTDAMCLDGGSSSIMVIGSRIVNTPSKSNVEVPVGIVVKKKF